MEALFISTGVVALAEIGDKTQLLAFILAARIKKPIPIIAGILVATLVNHLGKNPSPQAYNQPEPVAFRRA